MVLTTTAQRHWSGNSRVVLVRENEKIGCDSIRDNGWDAQASHLLVSRSSRLIRPDRIPEVVIEASVEAFKVCDVRHRVDYNVA